MDQANRTTIGDDANSLALSQQQRTPSSNSHEILDESQDSKEEDISELINHLRALWAKCLNIPADDISEDDTAISLGGNSTQLSEIYNSLRSQGLTAYPERQLQQLTLKEQSNLIQRRMEKYERDKTLVGRKYTGDELFPLSFAQEQIWLQLLESPSPLPYNFSVVLQFNGNTDTMALAKSANLFGERHQMTRSSIIEDSGKVYQRVHDYVGFVEISIKDFKDKADKFACISEYMQSNVMTPFNLTTGPLCVIYIILVSPELTLLQCVSHHIAVDGASTHAYEHEIRYGYEAIRKGDTAGPIFPPVDIQYTDYVLWQRSIYEKGELTVFSKFWQKYLENISPLNLPKDGPRVPSVGMRAEQVKFEWSEDLTKSIVLFSKEMRVTPFVVLLSALNVLLGRLTGQTDVSVLTAKHGRTNPKTRITFGHFINMLIVRSNVQSTTTFRKLVYEVDNSLTNILENQEYPFHYILQDLMTVSNGPCHPYQLFPVTITMTPKLSTNNLTEVSNYLEVDNGLLTSEILILIQEGEQLSGCIKYNPQIHCSQRIKQFMSNFETLVENALKYPETEICHLNLMSDKEKNRILSFGAGREVPFDTSRSLVQLFESQVKNTPTNVAVVEGDLNLSYYDLNKQAQNLSLELESILSKDELFVAVLLPQSVSFVRTTIAIMKAGKVVVPLSVNSPVEKMEQMLQDIGNPLLISTDEVVRKVGFPYSRIHILGMDYSVNPPEILSTFHKSGPAYVLFTSGSTGRPKPVIISNSSLVNYCYWIHGDFGLSAVDRGLAFNAVTFDLSLHDIWPILLCGASMIIPPTNLRYETEKLWQWIIYNQITFLMFPTAVGSKILSSDVVMEKSNLRVFMVGGACFRSWRPDLPFSLVNTYGLTETVISSTFTILDEQDSSSCGIPLWNTQIQILDEHLYVVPVGIPGKVYISGAGVSKYWDRDELNEQKFVICPHSGRIMCNTGDLGYWRFDGKLFITGRSDHQIKIRGFRLELGEVESAIRKYPNIIETVVMPDDNEELNAYCRIKPGSEVPNFQVFHQFLKERLSHFAIPSKIYIVDHFPVNTNGKIDKSALESQKMILVSPQFDPPQSVDEKIVARIWADLLGVPLESIGRGDNFFSLGGHSLLIAKVVSRLHEEYEGIDLKVEDLFRKPTVCGFVDEILSKRRSSRQKIGDSQISQSRGTHGLHLSLQQEQMWLHMQENPLSLTIYNETFNLDFNGVFNETAMNRALEVLISRHDILRSNYKETNGSAFMNISNHKNISVQQVNLQRAGRVKNLTAQALLFRSNKRSFKLDKERLIRFRLVRITHTLTRLQVFIHHLILDGFGMHFLEMELRQLYAEFCNNAVCALKLKPLVFQYPDFVLWQRKTFSSEGTTEKFKESQDFWKKQLVGLEPVNLFRQNRRIEVNRDRTGSTGFQLSRVLSDNIRNYSASQNTTPFVVILTALKVLLYRYTNQTDLFLLNASGGRETPESADLLGFFVNLVIIRTKIAKNSTFSELVKLVHWNQIEIMKHRDYPFQNVVRDAGLDTKTNGLFRLALTMEPRSIGANSVRSSFFFERSHHEAKFDLLICIDEHEIERNFIIYLVHNKSIYDEDTMKRFETHFKQILYSALEFPFKPIDSLALMSEMERKLALQTDKQCTEITFIPNQTNLYDLFLESVQKYPSNTAVSCMGSEMTYSELFSAARCLKNSLDRCCENDDKFLAVLLPQSINFIVSVIAIQCLGKTCVPLSVEYATKQLEYMLDEVGSTILITTKSVLEAKGLKYKRVFYIDELETQTSGPNFKGANSPNRNESPAYCLFTSASTGKAKAVILGQFGIINCVTWMKSECSLTDKDRSLLFCSPAFDMSLGEIWPMLLSGGTLCIPPDDTRYDMHKLFDWMNQERITFACLTTKIGEIIFNISAGQSGQHSSLRWLICSGEMLKTHPPKGVNYTVSNCYGNTETSIVCTVNNMKPGQQGVPNVGRGISNMRTYVLQPDTLTPVPVGVIGEIYVSGPGVALGYLNKPLKNLHTFIPDPHVKQSNGFVRTMMYKTGDLGYWLPTGELMVTGRQDSQIKILGRRIELGQIEESILEFGPVQETVVLLEDENKLAAYCVGQEVPSLEGMTSFLRQILPQYCIPSTFIFVPKIPLNPIGKVDRQKLIEYRSNVSTPILASNYAAPRTPEEIILAGIWSDILKIPQEQISREDNFFFLGGHSLQIAEMVHRLQGEPYNYCVSVRDVFRENSLRKLSRLLSSERLSRNTSAQKFSEISKDFTFYNVDGWLLKYPNIQQAAVILEDGSDSQSIVAFCVPSAPNSLTFISVYRFLCSNLPRHVVPTEIYTLTELPYNKNGKIDEIRLLTYKSHSNRLLVQNPVPVRGFPLKTREEIAIGDIWSQTLGVDFDSISVVDTFISLGGNSDQFEHARRKIAELFPGTDSGLNLTLTIEDLAKYLVLRGGSNVNELDVDFEMEIKFDLEIDSHLSSSFSGDILLTGSTGYFGSGLLVELLQMTQCKIHCLVRARDIEEAQRKLTAAIFPYDLDKSILNRVEIVLGDISSPNFGLAPQTYDILAKSISTIYHSAAEVHFLKNYSDLKRANVEGTKEVLRFSTKFTLKTLHFISTIGVFTDIAEPTNNNWNTDEVSLDETDICPHSYLTGYTQSKWVAEKLVWAAIKKGLPAIIYRPGQIGVHSQINHYNQSDLMATVLKSSIEIGFIPNSITMPTIYYGSLDYHCQTICSISLNVDNIGKVFHIFEQEILFEDVVQVLSKNVPLVTFQKWKSKLREYLTSSSHISTQENLAKNGIFSILSVLDGLNLYGNPMKGISISNSQTNLAVGHSRVKSTKWENIERFLRVIKTTDETSLHNS